MEDRHFLSEPRPVLGLKLPTWEVDIFRDGVDAPIMTILVDNQTLPPRKRKKKVVWKLPDKNEQMPKFGMEDKKRILELFKQQKKELRRQRKCSATMMNLSEEAKSALLLSSSGSLGDDPLSMSDRSPAAEGGDGGGAGGGGGGDGGGKTVLAMASAEKPPDVHPPNKPSSNGTKNSPRPINGKSSGTASSAPPGFRPIQAASTAPVSTPGGKPLPAKKVVPAPTAPPNSTPAVGAAVPAPPGINTPPKTAAKLETRQPKDAGKKSSNGIVNGTSKQQPKKMKNLSSRESTKSPISPQPKASKAKGIQPAQKKQLKPNGAKIQYQKEPKRSGSASPTHPPGIAIPSPVSNDSSNHTQTERPAQQQALHNTKQQPPPAPDAKSPLDDHQTEKQMANVNEHEGQPQSPPLHPEQLHQRHFISVPPHNTLAQVVTETYYVLLTRGLVSELMQYFTPTAFKSLTVGSAHAVCKSMTDFGLQLQSLNGIIVNIKGILQQPTVDNGILVLITGTCVQPHSLPFCHSLVLVPTNGDGGGGNNNNDNDGDVNNNSSSSSLQANSTFQIQNDALCFLTPTGAPTPPNNNNNNIVGQTTSPPPPPPMMPTTTRTPAPPPNGLINHPIKSTLQ